MSWLRSQLASSIAYGVVRTYTPSMVDSATIITNADYTIRVNDGLEYLFLSTGNTGRTVTLPAVAQSAGRTIKAIKIDAGTGSMVLDGHSSETINGATTQTVYGQYSTQFIACDGVAWFNVEDPKSIDSFSATFTQSNGYSQVVVIRYQAIGKQVSIIIPDFAATTTAAERIISSDLPAWISPVTSRLWFPCTIRQNAVASLGALEVDTTGVLRFHQNIAGSNFSNSQANSGSGIGSDAQSFTYLLN